MSEALFKKMVDAIVTGEIDEAGDLAKESLGNNIEPMTTVEKALIPAYNLML